MNAEGIWTFVIERVGRVDSFANLLIRRTCSRREISTSESSVTFRIVPGLAFVSEAKICGSMPKHIHRPGHRRHCKFLETLREFDEFLKKTTEVRCTSSIVYIYSICVIRMKNHGSRRCARLVGYRRSVSVRGRRRL